LHIEGAEKKKKGKKAESDTRIFGAKAKLGKASTWMNTKSTTGAPEKGKEAPDHGGPSWKRAKQKERVSVRKSIWQPRCQFRNSKGRAVPCPYARASRKGEAKKLIFEGIGGRSDLRSKREALRHRGHG